MVNYAVELAEVTQLAKQRHTAGSVRRVAVASILVGAMLLLLTVAGIVTVFALGAPATMLFGSALLGVTGGLVLWSAIRRLRTCRGRSGDEPVSFVAPYAFRITDDTLEFRETVGRAAESWPRQASRARVASKGGRRGLTLEHPDRSRRHFFASVLRETPERIQEIVSAPR